MQNTKTNGPAKKTKGKRKPAPKVENPDPRPEDLAAFALWWSETYGRLDQLTYVIHCINDAVRRNDAVVGKLFGSSELDELYSHLADTTSQWGASSPCLVPTPSLPEVVGRVLRR